MPSSAAEIEMYVVRTKACAMVGARGLHELIVKVTIGHRTTVESYVLFDESVYSH
jgi:hypothetical protein